MEQRLLVALDDGRELEFDVSELIKKKACVGECNPVCDAANHRREDTHKE
jgi:hypothetical protein